MSKLNVLIQELKENNQDFEFYPTTKEMIKTIYRVASGEDWLDIGCGTCNFKRYFEELRIEQLARKTQELKQYKASKQASYETMQRQWNEAVNKARDLEKECEELKKENQELRNSLSDSLMFRFTSQDKEVDRYRKAFEEIEEIACNEMCDMLGHFCISCDDKPTCKTLKILDIINKAKGGEDEKI